MDTLPMLGSVVILCVFIIIVFSVLFLQLVLGVLHNRCYDPTSGDFYAPDDGDYLCTLDNGLPPIMSTCPPYGESAFTTKPWVAEGKDVTSLANSYLVEYCNNKDGTCSSSLCVFFRSSQKLLPHSVW